MKPLRRLCAVLVLTLTLALSAFAGEISTGRAGEISTTKAGEITTMRSGNISTTVTATDIAIRTALNLYQSMLAVF